MPQSLAAVYLHLVFSTKDRHPFLRDPQLRKSLASFVAGTSKSLDCEPIQINGVEDHIHILARFGRTITIADWVKELKRVSSIWVPKQDAKLCDFRWQAGFGVFSVSHSDLQQVIEYIQRQEEHHRKLTYQEELRGLFQKHQIEFDERYVWD